MASNGKRMVKEDLIKKLENLPEGLEVVEANSTDESTEALTKLTVGDTVYSVPQSAPSTGTYVYSLRIYSTTFGASAFLTGISTHNDTDALDAIIEKYTFEWWPDVAYIDLYDGFNPSALNSNLTNDEKTTLYSMLDNAMRDPDDNMIIIPSSDNGRLIINVTYARSGEFRGTLIKFNNDSTSVNEFTLNLANNDFTGFASTLTTDDSIDLTIYKVA